MQLYLFEYICVSQQFESVKLKRVFDLNEKLQHIESNFGEQQNKFRATYIVDSSIFLIENQELSFLEFR